jgi:hypothetical protein
MRLLWSALFAVHLLLYRVSGSVLCTECAYVPYVLDCIPGLIALLQHLLRSI